MNVPVSRILGAIVLVAMGTLLPMGAASAEGTGAPGAAEKPRPPAPAAPPTGTAPSPAPPPAAAGDAKPPAESPEPPTEVKKEIERSKAAEGRAQELRAAALAHPNEVSYQVAYAQGLLDLGRTEEAVVVATAMAEQYPRSGEIMTILGRALARDGQFEVATVQYQRALALDPQNARTRALAAGISFIRGDLKAAEAGYRKALSLDASLKDARSSLAILLARAGRYKEAQAALGEAGKGDPLASGRLSLLPAFIKEPPFALPASFQKVSVPFVTAKGYPPFVRVKVNGNLEKLFVVDTGSEEILLTPGTAKALGLPEKGEGTVKDAEGRDHQTPAYVILDSFGFADLLVKRIPARVTPGLAYPDLQIGGSIGRDLLRRFRVTLDYGAKTLTLARGGGAPLNGVPFDIASVILLEGYRGDRAVGKFIIDTSSYTPGAMDIPFVARETGFTVYSPEVKQIPEGPYLFKFTMPDLKIGEASFENFPATAVDLRQMARQIGVNIRGVVGNSLLRQCRLEIDFENQRLTLRRLPQAPASAPASTPAPDGGSEPGS
jgi:tetratricopeptide (TPR) repeat protein